MKQVPTEGQVVSVCKNIWRRARGNYMGKGMAMCGEVIRLKREMEAAVRQRFDLVQTDRRNRSHTHLTLPFCLVHQKFPS